jgi:hypothetical protein
MRIFKLTGVLALALALAAISAATASAANTVEFLPGAAGTKFTGSSKEVVLSSHLLLEGKEEPVKFICEKSTSNGELVNAKEAKLTLDILGCKGEPGGLGASTAGDPAKTILVKATAKSCIISTSPLVGGILIKPEPVVITFATTNLTIEVTGDVIGRLLPENGAAAKLLTLDLNAPGTPPAQEFKECKDDSAETSKVETLKAKTDTGVVLPATLETKGALLQFVSITQVWDT